MSFDLFHKPHNIQFPQAYPIKIFIENLKHMLRLAAWGIILDPPADRQNTATALRYQHNQQQTKQSQFFMDKESHISPQIPPLVKKDRHSSLYTINYLLILSMFH